MNASSSTTIAQRVGNLTDYCPGAELYYKDGEREAAFRDLIFRTAPETTTGCIHGPSEPCPFLLAWMKLDEPISIADLHPGLTIEHLWRAAAALGTTGSAIVRQWVENGRPGAR